MFNPEQSAIKETNKVTDGGFGITDAFSGALQDMLKEARSAQCAFLNSKPAEASLPKAEVKEENGKRFLEFAAFAENNKDKSAEQPDQWLDGKTKLKPQAA